MTRKLNSILKHPLFITFVTFILTGILAALYQNHLEKNTKERDTRLAARQKATEAVKNITDLIYGRVFNGTMVVSSIERNAPIEELKQERNNMMTYICNIIRKYRAICSELEKCLGQCIILISKP
jgi:hypothetical protein